MTPPADRPPGPGRRGLRALADAAAGGARDVARLVLPVECPGCGEPDVCLCPACAGPFGAPPWRCEDAVPRLARPGGPPWPVWAVAPYAGGVRGVVVAWKDRGRADLTTTLGAAVRRAAADVGRAVPPARAPVLVVGVPTSAAARRRRGEDLVARLAREVAAGLTAGGRAAAPGRVLVRRGRSRDQVGLGARARGRNTTSAVRVRRAPGRPGVSGRDVVLVDDVVTTGATLVACEDAVLAAGGRVVGAFVLAATPDPSGDLGRLPRGALAG